MNSHINFSFRKEMGKLHFYNLSELERKEISNSKQVIFFFFFSKQWCEAKFSCKPRITIEIPGKSCLWYSHSRAHIKWQDKNLHDKILSWDCHPGTDAKIITQKLCWVSYASEMEDVDYWGYKSYTVTWRWECCMGERHAAARFPAKQNWHKKLWVTHRKQVLQFQLGLCLSNNAKH